MKTTRRTPARLVAAGLTLSVMLAACGDDGDDADDADAPATTGAPATDAPAVTEPASTEPAGAPAEGSPIPGGSADPAFCEAFVGIERGFANAPEDPAEIEAYAAANITPNAEVITATAPDELAAELGVMTGAVDAFLASGDFEVFESSEFSAAASVVYPGLDAACGIPNIAVTGVDYAFGGIPATTEAGLHSILFTNDSAKGEGHEIALFKLKEGVDLPVSELLAMGEDEVEEMIETFGSGTFAIPGASSGTMVDLTPGRWVYACFIPVGTTAETEGSGPPHFMEGMSGELIVT